MILFRCMALCLCVGRYRHGTPCVRTATSVVERRGEARLPSSLAATTAVELFQYRFPYTIVCVFVFARFSTVYVENEL